VPPMEPHDEFLELCALSTAGGLDEHERRKLEAHLAVCADCRQALHEFEAAVDVGVPLLESLLTAKPSAAEVPATLTTKSDESEPAGAMAPTQSETGDANAQPDASPRGFAFAQRNGHRRPQIHWNFIWLSAAACVLLTIALGIYAYRVGKGRRVEVTQTIPETDNTQIEALEQRMSDVGHDREALQSELAQRDNVISDLRAELQAQSASLAAMKSAQADLEKSVQNQKGEKQQSAQDRGVLLAKLDTAQAALQKTQTQLESLERDRAEEASRADSLGAQVNDLHAELREREETLNKQEDLLAHDRDVRELIGARDLYIAEIYDVARDGVTQKPYGRVFYTKGKSLIFYAYDLDKEAGVQTTSTFQAWGQHGPDRQKSLNLGIFYEDSAAKKRWVLKFNDPKTLDEINAVFVTVEPSGGSPRPSGSPLLFAYLKIGPNHP
jgi:predicted  nucleic acid-binding Zn-ribbon protein